MSNINSIGSSQIFDYGQNNKSIAPKQEQQQLPSDGVSLGGNQDTAVADKKKWTILLYSAADNNLERALVADVAELETVGSTKDMNVLVQLDRGKRPSSMSDGWAGARRFYLNQDADKSRIDSPVLDDMGQINMADPKVLADFITWGVKNYPAENYMLVMSDHGGAHWGALEDDSHGGALMSIPQLREALEMAEQQTGAKMAIVGFDACLMANTETADELAGSAQVMVASEEVEGGEGWNYNKIFSSKSIEKLQTALDTKFNIDPREVAIKMVNDTHGFPSIGTLSAIDLTQMKNVTAATDEFAKAVLKTTDSMADIRSVINSTKDFSGYAKDQIDFAEKLIKNPNIKDPALKETAQAMIDAVKSAVIAEQHSYANNGANGLQMEISPNGGNKVKFGHAYQDLAFAKKTHWDEAMAAFAEGKGEVEISTNGPLDLSLNAFKLNS